MEAYKTENKRNVHLFNILDFLCGRFIPQPITPFSLLIFFRALLWKKTVKDLKIMLREWMHTQSLYCSCISNGQRFFEIKKLFKINAVWKLTSWSVSLPLLTSVFHTANCLSQESIHICLDHNTINFFLGIYLCFSSSVDFWAWKHFTFFTILLA